MAIQRSMGQRSLQQRPIHEVPLSRRDALVRGGAGFGALALSYLMSGERAAAAPTPSPLAPKERHNQAKARSVIFLFMEGGPSHMDTFDPKPLLNKLAGKPLPESFDPVITPMGELNAPLLASQRKWKQHGQSGLWVSDWLPHIATCADDIAVIRSCHTDGINHAGGVCQMNTGVPLGGRPSLGAWVTYGLGTENRDLPAFVVLQDNRTQIVNGPRNWGTGFMPALYQGTPFKNGAVPIENLNNPGGISDARQRRKLALLRAMNQRHAAARPENSDLEARIRSYELAFRMQAAAPEAVDLSGETEETKKLYGMDQKDTAAMGRNCLLARRMVERGVRFVQVYHGAGSKWDSHSKIEKNHARQCKQSDQPVAALLKDLKRRGLWDDVLVVWGGEFGRTPMSEKGDGRDHNVNGFTMWMAGGDVRGGQTIGKTDEVGLHAIEDRMHVHDLHATILRLIGLHHMEVEYYHKGRPERPTLNEGRFNEKLVTG